MLLYADRAFMRVLTDLAFAVFVVVFVRLLIEKYRATISFAILIILYVLDFRFQLISSLRKILTNRTKDAVQEAIACSFPTGWYFLSAHIRCLKGIQLIHFTHKCHRRASKRSCKWTNKWARWARQCLWWSRELSSAFSSTSWRRVPRSRCPRRPKRSRLSTYSKWSATINAWASSKKPHWRAAVAAAAHPRPNPTTTTPPATTIIRSDRASANKHPRAAWRNQIITYTCLWFLFCFRCIYCSCNHALISF